MADLKISALTASTVPLAGTEVLPIVQSSTTKQVSVANLTAGRAVSMLSGTVTDNIATPVPFNINNNSANTAAGTRVNFQFNGSTVGYVGNQFDGADFNNLYDANRFHIFTVGGTEYFRIVNADVTVKTGNLVIGTSGKGIDFSATPGTGTSELLADYEEGTWTPVPVPTSGAITTYTSTGIYTKVGRQVTLTFNITISNAGTAVALSSITGMPFANGGVVAPGCGREAGVTGAMWQYTIAASATSIVGKSYANDPSIVSGYILYGSVTYTV